MRTATHKTASVKFGKLGTNDPHVINVTVFYDNSDERQYTVAVTDDVWNHACGTKNAEKIASILDWQDTEHDGGIVHAATKEIN